VIVPHVATARLLLREFRRTDFDGYAAALADPIAAQVGGVAVDRRLAWRSFATGIGTWVLEGAGWWGVELVETGAMIGTVGAFFRETSPEL
jgi:RimJ/RimL family protein N-acetyltransferase